MSEPPKDPPATLSGDRPIETGAQDVLGFDALAKSLADALMTQASPDGLVFGLEGAWGSGKSSLLRLIANNLSALPLASRPVVIDFRPWLVGQRDALLSEFFGQLAAKLEPVEAEHGGSSLADAKCRHAALKALKSYADGLNILGDVLAVIPGAGMLGKAAKAVAKPFSKGPAKESLVVVKARLDEALQGLSRRIVVTIDDVDRLEPQEVIEVLRLIRSVADFSNVVYILCYDGQILAQSIETSLRVPDGTAYLEKIVQVGASVPIPEPFQLRRWFDQALGTMGWELSETDRARAQQVIDVEGGRRLITPRHVVRALNALHLLAPRLRGEVDLADLIWLQLIRAGNPNLYRWIEAYCAEAAASAAGRVSIDEPSKLKTFKELQAHLDADGLDFNANRFELAEHLPAVSMGRYSEGEKTPLYRRVERTDIGTAVSGRRLASPDHYRLYFALAAPATAPQMEDFSRLAKAALESDEAVAALFRTWQRQTDPSIGSKAEVVMARLEQGSAAALSPGQRGNIFLALSRVADEGVRRGDANTFSGPSFWTQATSLTRALLADVDPERRSELLAQACNSGKALGWLTTLLRRETFAHGRGGARQGEDEANWLFTDAELDMVASLMSGRYLQLGEGGFAALPNPLSALFAWLQSGHEAEAKGFVNTAAQSPQGLVTVLELMESLVHSSDGNFRVIQRENVQPFFEYDMTRARLTELAEQTQGDLQARVVALLQRFKDAED